LVGGGGEGMVVKPKDFIARGDKGLLQPALKVRGREYRHPACGYVVPNPACWGSSEELIKNPEFFLI
jgi:hypothetical protein